MKKKMLSLALVLACALSILQVPASATFSYEDPFSLAAIQAEATELIQIAFNQGVIPGQNNSNITSLYLCDSIPIYELQSDNILSEADDIKYYPIFDQNDVARGMIIARLQGNNETLTCEYNTFFCEELTTYKQNDAEVCFIFDQEDIIIYDGYQADTILHSAALKDDSRGVFNMDTASTTQFANLDSSATSTSQLAKLDRSTISPAMVLNPLSTTATTSSTSGSLSVPIITQSPWENGCWAASAVCAGRYLNPSVRLTVTDVMKNYAGGQDVAKSYISVQDVLAYEYGYETNQHLLSSLTMRAVMNSIGVGTDNGDPIIARVSYSGLSSGHFIVVRGYIYTAGTGTLDRATIMDSLYGSGFRILSVVGTGESMTFKYTPLSGTTLYDVGMYLTFTR